MHSFGPLCRGTLLCVSVGLGLSPLLGEAALSCIAGTAIARATEWEPFSDRTSELKL